MSNTAKTVFIYLASFIFIVNCQSSNSLAKEGLKYLEQGKKITALKFFEDALNANKKNPIALYGKGKIMTESNLTMGLGQKLIESAIPRLEAPYKIDAVISLGKSYAATNLYNRAIKVLNTSISEGSQSPEIYMDLSFYYLQTLETNQARNSLLKGLAVFPKSVPLYLSLASLDAKYYNNNYASIQSLEKALQIENNNPDILKKIAISYYKLGNIPKTVEFLNLLKNAQRNNDEKLNTEKWITQAQSARWQINP